MKPNYFRIPKPCSADWNQMTPTEQGAFCKQCNKEIVDLFAVPSDQIKDIIQSKNNPCVRILQHQIDEMNFTEWFRSISLTKQLRFLFLFTLLFVFQHNGLSQNTDTTFIPYSNEYLDELELKQEDIEDIEVSITTLDSSNNVAIVLPPVNFPPYPDIRIGMYDSMTVTPWIPGEFYDIALIGGTTFESIVPHDDTTVTPNINSILLDGSLFTFSIYENELHFSYKAVEPQNVRINVTNEKGEMVYFLPIGLKKGKNKSILSLEKFQSGRYTITLQTDKNSQSTEIIYL